jgi:hypothetical protein
MKKMTDIVERLRKQKWQVLDEMRGLIEDTTAYEAADEIERLRNELQRIADVSERWKDSLVSQINEMAHEALGHKK